MSERTTRPEPVPEGDELDQELSTVPEPGQTGLPSDPEAPEADALDQAREVAPRERMVAAPRTQEAGEADALDQSLEVPLDDDDRRS